MSQQPTDRFGTSCGATAPLELNVSGPGRAGGERHVFEHPFVLIGRHERSCLRLEDGAVSRRHAYLQQFGGRVFCVDLGSRTGIRWGGECRPAGWLRPEKGVQIGPFTLELAMAARGGVDPEERVAEDWDPLQDRTIDRQFLPRITLENGNEVVSRLCMNRMLVLVGSSPDCRIRLRGSGISSYHCSLARTPQGVWLIDLLNDTGTRLNGQSLPCVLVKEGDRLQVGSYVLRFSYPDAPTEMPPPSLMEISAGTPVPPAEDTSESGQRPSRDQARERQQDVEILRQQRADNQAECERLREQVRALEVQVAEMAGLQARLEVAEANGRERDVVRNERDRWQTEAQNLQTRLASESADREQRDRLAANLHAAQLERDQLRTEQQMFRQSAEQASGRMSELEQALTEAATAHESALEAARARWESERQALEARLELEGQTHHEAVQAATTEVQARAAEREVWRQQLEAAQQELVGEREAVRAAGTRLDQESATLQKMQAELAARNVEHDAALQRLQEAQKELALSQDEARSLQAELAQALERQRDIETLKQQLADVRARVPELEDRLRDAGAETERLRVQLRAAESQEAELEAVHVECERLREQARALEAQPAEQASGRVSELEQMLTEAAAAHETALEEARAHWESKRQALEARLELEGQTHREAVQAAVRDVLARVAADREQWRQQMEGAESQLVWERGMFQEQIEQVRQQAAGLQAERDRLAARLNQAELPKAAEERSLDEARRAAELQHLRGQDAREQVFAQLSAMRLGHLLQQTARTQCPDAPAEQARPSAILVREQAPVEEQRPTVIVQEVQSAWGEVVIGQERLPAIGDPPSRVGGQVSEVGGEKAVEQRSASTAPAVPADEGETSAPSDPSGCLPRQKTSQPEARQKLWRQILGFVLGK